MSDYFSQKKRLEEINSPADLRQLSPDQLPAIAAAIRSHLIEKIDICGGHLGSNLGAIELTIALHYIYNTPYDRLIFDVGHQAYPHKILTGRRDQLHTIKQAHGLAPFPSPSESEYDSFGVGHSSTSISAALGIRVATQDHQPPRRVVAIIGDGGITGGLAFEALNHAGELDPNMLVVLNDNDMSISENIGGLNRYLSRILSGKFYCTMREGSKKVLAKMPPLSRLAKKTEQHLKGMVQPGTLFEELGFNYLGPIDGHDIPTLIKTLRHIQNYQGAKLLHIITTKGKGFRAAEQNPIHYHAVKPGFNNHSNKPPSQQLKPLTYSNIFGQWICDMAKIDPRLIAITPAMREGSDLIAFAKQYKQRFFDVSIAEQHAVTFAAGLATEGKKPIVAIYSTFLQRAYDQLIHDVAIQNLDVTFAIDRAGLVGSDGPTHAGSFDLTYLRCIPNMIIMAPANENECRQMLYTAYQYQGPAAVRYPRGTGPNITIDKNMQSYPLGKGIYCRKGHKIAILAFGSMVQPSIAAGHTLDATVVNMRFIKPIDGPLLREIADQHDYIVTVEENSIMGGAGSAVSEWLNAHNFVIKTLHLGLPDKFIPHGNRESMLMDCGLDTAGILQSIQSRTHSTIHSDTNHVTT